MMRKGSKAERICKMLDQGLSVQEVAERVGCLDAYVRAVRQRRLGGGKSAGDRNYEASPLNKSRLARSYKKQKFLYRMMVNDLDRTKIAEAARCAYKKARKKGASWQEATLKSRACYAQFVMKHGDREKAKAAYDAAKMLGSDHETV